MFRVGRRVNPLRWALSRVPRSKTRLEEDMKKALKIVFWFLLLAPVVLFPLYYLIVALGG